MTTTAGPPEKTCMNPRELIRLTKNIRAIKGLPLREAMDVAKEILASESGGTELNFLDCWSLVGKVIESAPRTLLFGPPGTGKTHFGATAGVTPDHSVYSVTMTEESAAAELRGHFIPKGTEFVWHDGIFVRAWRDSQVKPTRLVINEIDHASDDVLSLLHVVLDDITTARLTLPTGETVQPGPKLQIVATMNGIPKHLRSAVRDRFPVTVEIDRVHPEAVAQLPQDLRKVAAQSTVTTDEERRVSIRVWYQFAALRTSVGDEVAAQACFGKRAADVLNALRIANGIRTTR